MRTAKPARTQIPTGQSTPSELYLLLLLSVLLILTPAGAAAAKPEAVAETEAGALQLPSLDDLLAIPNFGLPTLSPSGRYVAALQRDKNKVYVVVIDLEQNTTAAITSVSRRSNINELHWITEDRLLYSLTSRRETRRSQRGNWIITRPRRDLVALNRDGSKQTHLMDGDEGILYGSHIGELVDVLPADPENVLVVGYAGPFVNLYRLNVFSGALALVTKGTKYSFNWFTDRTGRPVVRFDSHKNGRVTKVMVHKPGKRPEGIWQENFRFRTDFRTNGEPLPEFRLIGPGEDPTTYYVVAKPDGHDTFGIHLYDYRSNRFLKTLREYPGIDIGRATFDRKTQQLTSIMYQGAKGLRLELQNKTADAHIRALNKYFGNTASVLPLEQSRSENRWLLFVDGPTEPGSYHIYDVDTSNAREIGVRRPRLLGKTLAPMEVVHYQSRDGTDLFGYLTSPPGKRQTPPPLVMMPHGGPQSRDYYEFDLKVQILAAHGYQVFQPNFRGSSGFGDKFAAAGYRQWGRAMQTDVDDALDHLVETGRADRARACIVGASYGGYVALVAATDPSTPYQCSAAIAPVTDLVSLMKHDRKKFGANSLLYAEMERQLGTLSEHKAEMVRYSPAQNTDKAKVPVLLLHGKEDKRVPVQQSILMAKGLAEHVKPHELIEAEDADHSFGTPKQRRLYHETVLGFLAKHLPTPHNTGAD